MSDRAIGRLRPWQTAVFIALPLVSALIALCIGRVSVSPAEVFAALGAKLGLGGEVSELTAMTLWKLRLPRILLALLAGAGLSVAGCAFQSLFANPLATPDTLGVAGGASFGAALGILLGFGLIGIQLSALIMGFAAVALTALAAGGRRSSLGRVVLSGIMIGSLFSSLVSLLKFLADTESQLPAITYWLMGGLDRASYKGLVYGAPMIIAGTAVLFALRWRMNLLPLSDDEARSSGVNMKALRCVTILCATAITASVVSMCGQVGWVGLLIPHMCRMRLGSNHMALLPSSVSMGAVFMVTVDTLARSVSAAEIPVSLLTAIIGAPFFIILMRRGRGWSL